MKKKVLAVLLGGCMVAGLLAGCGGDKAATTGDDAATTEEGGESSGGGDYHFEVVVKSFQSTYWQAAIQGIDAAVEELGVTVNTTGPNAESDIATRSARLRTESLLQRTTRVLSLILFRMHLMLRSR